ncbi:SPOR domain-containing protein [Dokdonella sp. MW10]|uniref:SPOR domain-containing protein n=1 Tax=Dokdonella sp. MW10 TaxID=2992926 RepID=UPI003F7F42D4
MATRSRKQATRGGSRQWPAWVWLGIGVLLGLAGAVVFLAGSWAPMLRGNKLPQPNPAAVAPRESDPPVADGKDAKPKKAFDFYSVLPEMEVVIPDAEISAKARDEAKARAAAAQQQAQTPPGTPTPPPAAVATGGARYLLQAGSYPNAKSAEEIKAKLALSGFFAQVYPVTINGKTWHRVRLGPYASASELEAAKASLAENGVNAIALKEEAGR